MKRIASFIALSVLLGVGSLLLAAGPDRFSRNAWLAPDFAAHWWLIALAFVALGWGLPIVKIRILARWQGTTPTVRQAWFVHVSTVFGSAVTPSGTGGAPAMVMALHRYGLPYGRAMAVAMQHAVLDLAVFAVLIPAGLAYLLTASRVDLPTSLRVVAASSSVIAIMLAWFLSRRPKPITRMLLWLSARKRLRRGAATLKAAARDYQRAARTFQHVRPGQLAWLLALSIGIWLANFALFWALGRAFGLRLPLPDVVALLSTLTLASFIIPTPGASGFMELVLALVLRERTATIVAGPILYWRIGTFYLAYLIGPLVSWFIMLERPPRWLRRLQRSNAPR